MKNINKISWIERCTLIIDHYESTYKISLSPHMICDYRWIYVYEIICYNLFFSSFFFCTILRILDHGDLLGKLLGKAHGSLSGIGMEVTICGLFARKTPSYASHMLWRFSQLIKISLIDAVLPSAQLKVDSTDLMLIHRRCK